MTHRHLEYSNYPPKYQLQYQEFPPRTPTARRDTYGLDSSSSQFSKTWKFNDMSNNSTDAQYLNLSTIDPKKTYNSDYLKLSK